VTEVPHSFAVLWCKDLASSHVKGREESKMSCCPVQEKVSVAASSGRLKGHVNKLNLSDSLFIITF